MDEVAYIMREDSYQEAITQLYAQPENRSELADWRKRQRQLARSQPAWRRIRRRRLLTLSLIVLVVPALVMLVTDLAAISWLALAASGLIALWVLALVYHLIRTRLDRQQR